MAVHDRFTATNAALLLIDLQEKLLAPIADRGRIVANAARLAQAAGLLGVTIGGSEQNPSRLGQTVPALSDFAIDFTPKMSFRITDFSRFEKCHVTVAGIETHVCVLQTVLELLGQDFRVQVATDAVGSRSRHDGEVALQRMENAGAILTTTEAVLFEWIETADHPHFKSISALIKNFARPE